MWKRSVSACSRSDSAKTTKSPSSATTGPTGFHAELAAQSLGAVPVGIYPDSVSEELFSLTDACDAKILIVEDQEQVDKVLEVRDRLHDVERIVYADERGMRLYDDPMLRALCAG